MVTKTEKWEKQEKAIRATQLAFDLSANVQKTIKKVAIDEDLTPSDMIRQILGLEVKSKKTRQRLSFYLNDDELAELAQKFEIEKEDKRAIKQRVAEKLIQYAAKESPES
ncbi:hypothetical protein [Algicola sagamiensis]|uniref:hypothetical protein n=1 Tax=Algicola sagamiensis TaxID=163869 RepID=UPI00036FD7CA|nr:hypothetical protein [Algicola sagamiensis]